VDDNRLRIRVKGSSLELALHVQPRARRTEFAGQFNGALKLKVAAPPVDDAANRAVIKFFAALLGLPKSSLAIVSGTKSRGKILRIDGLSISKLTSLLPPDSR